MKNYISIINDIGNTLQYGFTLFTMTNKVFHLIMVWKIYCLFLFRAS